MLSLKAISKSYGTHQVLDAIDLDIPRGELLALLGPSGCGKSTLLSIIAGLLPPDAGELFLHDEPIETLPPEARHVAMIFQDFALFPHLNVQENVAFGLIERGMPKKEARLMAAKALDEIGLTTHAHRRTWSLSGGEQQRVALARAFVTSPKLMLLDEPFSNLDTHLKKHLQADLKARLALANIPAILVTHDKEEAFTMAERVAILHEGRLLQCGSPKHLYQNPASAWIARFIGLQNVFPEGFLPQEAFFLDAKEPPVRITAIEALSEGWSLHITTQIGPLVLRLSAREAAHLPHPPAVGALIPVGIRMDKMRYFSPIA